MTLGLVAAALTVSDETVRAVIAGLAIVFLLAYLWRRWARIRRERRRG
jgi:hypothetical protein